MTSGLKLPSPRRLARAACALAIAAVCAPARAQPPTPPPSAPISATSAAPAAPWKAQGGGAIDKAAPSELQTSRLLLGDLGETGDITFVEIFDHNDHVTFGIPPFWNLTGPAELHLHMAWSPQVLPDVSTVTVYLDNRPVGTVRMAGDPDGSWLPVIKLPLTPSKVSVHRLEFRAFQRAHLPCEPTELPGLWSRIIADSYIDIRYKADPPRPSLADWPRPLRDERDPATRRIVMALRPSASVEEIKTAGYLASWLGHSASWRPLDLVLYTGPLSAAPPGHVIVVMRGDQADPRWSELQAMASGPDMKPFTDLVAARSPWPRSGILVELPRPGAPGDVVIGVLGASGKGLTELGSLLASAVPSSLVAGTVQLVNGVAPSAPLEERRWDATMPPDEQFQLKDLGYHDRSVNGPRKATTIIPLHMIPDDHPVAGRVRMNLNYSYSAQVDIARSRIDVSLNDAYVAGAALAKLDGENRASMVVDLPAHEMGPQTELEVTFSLIHRARPPCVGDPTPPVWGTVHADTSLDVPRDRWSRGPDLSLLQYGGFPFGVHPDLLGTRFVLPKAPSETELQMFLWFAAEFGRVVRGDRFNYEVSLGGPIDLKRPDNLVVVDSSPGGALLHELGLSERLSFRPATDSSYSQIDFAPGRTVELAARTDATYIQELALADTDRTALVAWASRPELFQRVGRCLAQTPLFDRLRGQLARITSCDDMATMTTLEHKVQGRQPIQHAAYEPVRNHYWTLLAAVMASAAAIVTAGLLWRRRGRRRVLGAGEEATA